MNPTQTSDLPKPYRYLVIGNGRWATHLKKYLEILNLPFAQWNRSQPLAQLQSGLLECTHVLLAISDSALESFQREHLRNFPGLVVYFSGALELNGAVGVHPLMSFGPELYHEETYRRVPFVTTSALSLQEILPEFPNSLHRLRADQKPYYHALCVLGGNLTTLLIKKMNQGFSDLNLPPELGQLFIQQVVQNVFSNPGLALTGPLARKDFVTVDKNLKSLQGDPFAAVYQSFLPIAFPEYSTEVKNENPRL